MIGSGASFANAGPTIFNSATPAQLNIPSFDNGRRIRVVLITLPGASRFQINFRTPSDIAYHFNPRFDENCVVGNSTSNGGWLNEERTNMPFRPDRTYTVDFISIYGQIQVEINGVHFTTFAERLPGYDIHVVEIDGDVHVHSAHFF